MPPFPRLSVDVQRTEVTATQQSHSRSGVGSGSLSSSSKSSSEGPAWSSPASPDGPGMNTPLALPTPLPGSTPIRGMSPVHELNPLRGMSKEQAKYLASGGLGGKGEKMKEKEMEARQTKARQKERQKEWEREKQRVEDEHAENDLNLKLSFKQRMRHFTWTWFTMTMATGGIANVIYTVPYRFHGIYALGCIFFLLNIVLFIFNVSMISTRFYLYPATFKSSFRHPTESLFIPASIISLGTILINITQYGVGKAGPWLTTGVVWCYWVYCGLAVLGSCGIFLIMWSTQTHTISRMTPVWIFPAYPLLIIGPFAGVLAAKTTGTRALAIIVGGYTLQGIGFMVSLMIYSAFLYRLMTQKLPKESLRPGMFISVGPSGFTIAGLVTMGAQLPRVVVEVGGAFMTASGASPAPSTLTFALSQSDAHMTTGLFAAEVSRILANWAGLWLWGLALWFFFVSVGAHWTPLTNWRMDFGMTWFSFVFPNTALTTATFAVARALDNNRPIEIVGCVLSVALVLVWGFVAGCMVKAVVGRQILWPQKQEDREEGGWVKEEEKEGTVGGRVSGRVRGWSMGRSRGREWWKRDERNFSV